VKWLRRRRRRRRSSNSSRRKKIMVGARRQRGEMNMVTTMTMMNTRTIMMIENDMAMVLWRFSEGMQFCRSRAARTSHNAELD
jgi:hypothetical protein